MYGFICYVVLFLLFVRSGRSINAPLQPVNVCWTKTTTPTRESGITQAEVSLYGGKSRKQWTFAEDYVGPIIDIFQCLQSSNGGVIFVSFIVMNTAEKVFYHIEPGYHDDGCLMITETKWLSVECSYSINSFNHDCISLKVSNVQPFKKMFEGKMIRIEITSSAISSTSRCVDITPIIAKKGTAPAIPAAPTDYRTYFTAKYVLDEEHPCRAFFVVGFILGFLLVLAILLLCMPISHPVKINMIILPAPIREPTPPPILVPEMVTTFSSTLEYDCGYETIQKPKKRKESHGPSLRGVR